MKNTETKIMSEIEYISFRQECFAELINLISTPELLRFKKLASAKGYEVLAQVLANERIERRGPARVTGKIKE